VSFQFADGAAGARKKSPKIAYVPTTITFGDVGGNRTGCASNLRNEAELLLRRENGGDSVANLYQVHGLCQTFKSLTAGGALSTD